MIKILFCQQFPEREALLFEVVLGGLVEDYCPEVAARGNFITANFTVSERPYL